MRVCRQRYESESKSRCGDETGRSFYLVFVVSNEHFSLSEDSSLPSLRLPWVSWFNRQLKLSITGVDVKRVAMTTNNIADTQQRIWALKHTKQKHFTSKLVPSSSYFFKSGNSAAPNQSYKKSSCCLSIVHSRMEVWFLSELFFPIVTFTSFPGTFCVSWTHCSVSSSL